MPLTQTKNMLVPFLPSKDSELAASVAYGLSIAAKTRAHLTWSAPLEADSVTTGN